MRAYDHKRIEKKWQAVWKKKALYKATAKKSKKKSYLLIEFPYPSGAGLHVGHVRSYTALDVLARKRRGEGENVLYPIGWDAFGLPTENYAIKTGIHPIKVTKDNTNNFRKQLQSLGFSFDWSREVNTSDPAYYRWTQWIFIQLFKAGLAYKAKSLINWCLQCKIGLANEEVVDGKCERCGSETEKREKEQWMLAITKYADRLDKDLEKVDFQERIKTQQRNWIGRSEGAQINFQLILQNNAEQKLKDRDIEVFTTRPDTLFGATYLVLAPEHPLLGELVARLQNKEETLRYIVRSKKRTERERTTEAKEKTGIELKGVKAVNPANGEQVPIFVADYVLPHYGTGAIMAVPAHDERDNEFARKFKLPIRVVIFGSGSPYEGRGKLINSKQFNGLDSEEAKKQITEFVGGKWVTTFKLRDWIFSRQRYWGEPIPMIHCSPPAGGCGWQTVPEKDLPVKLPKVKNYKPTDTGESPLAAMDNWVKTKCPKCGGPARRETDVMPNWAGSSWYFLRYTDPKNKKEFASKKKLEYWLGPAAPSRSLSGGGVDWYNGGMEHTTLHLLYSRFWHKFLYDLKLVPTSEPYKKRTSHGLILAEGGEKMSKSKGNVINPDELVVRFGADSLRLYEMFVGPFAQEVAWNSDGLVGMYRFLERLWRAKGKVSAKAKLSSALEVLLHRSIAKVGEDIEEMHFNTAVSQLMVLLNSLDKEEIIPLLAYRALIRLLAPFAPHITEEIWQSLGGRRSVHQEMWPKHDASKLNGAEKKLVVQVNGKVRAVLNIETAWGEEEVLSRAEASAEVSKWLSGKTVLKRIYVPGKVLNFVVQT